MNEVKILSSDATSYTLGGYGVLFGGEDLTGEGFSKSTDFWLDRLSPTPPVLYQHGFDPRARKSVMGKATIKQDDIGLWVETQIQLSNEYAEAIQKLTNEGRLGWSSGSVGHLVEREGKVIKSWPIAEFSLTPTPAEPRTLGVSELRSLVADEPEVEAVLPKDTEVSAAATKSEPATVSDKPIVNERKTKMDFTQENIQDMLTKALENMPAFQKALHTSPDETGSTDKLNDSTKSFANFLVSVHRHDTKRLEQVYKAALAETSGATGGYTVPTEYANEILAIATEQSIIRPRAFVIPNVKGEYDVPALYNGGGASGTPASLAGVVATWTAEGGTKTETEPTFDMIKLVPHELSGYTLASNKIMADNGPALESTLRRLFGEAIAWYEDYAFLRSTGAGQPLGIINSPCFDTTMDNATDSKIVIADLAGMLAYFYMPHWDGACWIMSQDVFPQLVQLVASSSGNLIWMPQSVRGDPLASDMLLFGKPVFFTEKWPTIGAANDVVGGVLLCNLRDYIIADGVGGMSIDYSAHYKFINNQGTWRFTKNVDGQPWLKNKITTANGSTVSPFVGIKGPA